VGRGEEKSRILRMGSYHKNNKLREEVGGVSEERNAIRGSEPEGRGGGKNVALYGVTANLKRKSARAKCCRLTTVCSYVRGEGPERGAFRGKSAGSMKERHGRNLDETTRGRVVFDVQKGSPMTV